MEEPDWQKSSFCINGNCVEVGIVDDSVLLRDSKRPAQRPLMFTVSEFADFLAGAKAGEFDRLV